MRKRPKNPNAVALGRLGGKAGGKAGGRKGFAALSPERRSEIAAMGGRAGRGRKKPRKKKSKKKYTA